jgi:hypothetical protein
MRGLLMQYVAALLSVGGVPVEVAPRLISAVSSLLTLPAAFLIGRRMGGFSIGLLAVTVLALSIWEVEMARFGRMYAPFQAVFVWYLLYFMRRTVDGDTRADRPMMLLTIVGALLWEGGIFLAFANFLPLALRARTSPLRRQDWCRLGGFAILFAAVYLLVSTDFRLLGAVSNNPQTDASSGPDSTPGVPWAAVTLFHSIATRDPWLLASMVPLIACTLAAVIVWRRRGASRVGAATLAVCLAAGLVHQFLLAASLLLLVPLLRPGSGSALNRSGVKPVYVALTVCFLFWLTADLTLWNPPTNLGPTKMLLARIYPLLGLPDVMSEIIVPWGGAIPWLGAGLTLLLAILTWTVARQESAEFTDARCVLSLVVILLLITAATHPPRHETRYVFFLYPALIVLAIAGVSALVSALRTAPQARACLVASLALGLFALSDDFSTRHLLTIDRPATMYKPEQNAARQSHLVVRDDTRALADWLHRNLKEGTVLVSAFQSLDFYVSEVKYFYVDRNDFNFESYACQGGTLDRWSNRPLLSSPNDLKAAVRASRETYFITYTDHLPPLLSELATCQPSVEASFGHLTVMRFGPSSCRLPPTG